MPRSRRRGRCSRTVITRWAARHARRPGQARLGVGRLGSTILTITAQDADPARAAAIANALANQLIAASPAVRGQQTDVQKFVDADLKTTQAQITAAQTAADALSALTSRTATQDATLATLQAELTSLQATYATLLGFSSAGSANLLSVIQPAVAPDSPISPRPLLNVLLAIVLAFLLSAGAIFLLAYLDDTIHSPEQVEELIGLPTLGTVFKMGRDDSGQSELYRLATLVYPRSAAAEAYRTLRTNVEFTAIDEPIRTLLITSAIPGEGKTVTAANLAIAFALSGRRVLLVDADLRRPGLHRIFDLPNTRGLTTLLQSDAVTLDSLASNNLHERLRVLTSGPLPPNPAEIAGSDRMRRVFEKMQTTADLVIVDSPPLQAVTDAAVLSSFMDGTILVVDTSKTHRSTIVQAREALVKANARVIGVVLNRLANRRYANDHPYSGYYDDNETAASGSATVDSGQAQGGLGNLSRLRKWRIRSRASRPVDSTPNGACEQRINPPIFGHRYSPRAQMTYRQQYQRPHLFLSRPEGLGAQDLPEVARPRGMLEQPGPSTFYHLRAIGSAVVWRYPGVCVDCSPNRHLAPPCQRVPGSQAVLRRPATWSSLAPSIARIARRMRADISC